MGAAGRPEGLAFSGSERQILGRPGQWCWIGRSAPYCGVAFLDFEASLEAALVALRKKSKSIADVTSRRGAEEKWKDRADFVG